MISSEQNVAASAESSHLIDSDNSISNVVKGDLAVVVHVQDVKSLLSLLSIQEMLQILWQDVSPAIKTAVFQQSRNCTLTRQDAKSLLGNAPTSLAGRKFCLTSLQQPHSCTMTRRC